MNKEGRGIMEKEEGTMDNEGEGREWIRKEGV